MAGSMIFPESFTPPDCGATRAGSRPPPWILLDLDAYLADRRNATTATATSSLGHTIQVSFFAADPPAMSYLCAHCPCSKPGDGDPVVFGFEPRVIGAEGRLVLLWVRFTDAGGHRHDDEYFMYKADPDSPSLEHVSWRHAAGHRLPLFQQLAVVPLGGDGGGHYLLAGRSVADGDLEKHELHIYSSADQTWSIKPLPEPDDGRDILPDKVITLGDGGGVVGWVDLRVGVAVCDLLAEPLAVRFVPLPEPMPANRGTLEEFRPGDPAWRFRDVAFSDGALKFVEVEHRWIVTTVGPPPPADPSEMAVLLDADLVMARRRRKEGGTEPRQVRRRDGWRMVTWSRAMSSDRWHRGCVIDVDDIAVNDAMASSLRSMAGDEHHEHFKQFRNMYAAFPTLSTAGADDLVYFKTVAKVNDSKAWMIAVDVGKKMLTALGAYPFAETRHDPCLCNYRLCALSNYLNMDPDSSQPTKLKDSADSLKTPQSSAEEASCPCKDKPRDPLLLELKAQEDHRSVRDEHGADFSNEECSGASSGPLPPPASRLKQSDGAGADRPNPADVSPVNVVARPTGSSLLPPQVPSQLDFGGNHPNAHAFNHPNAHAVVNHHHHLHDATGFSRSCPPPAQPAPQQNMSHWNGVSYHHQNHPWPLHHQQYAFTQQAQQWNGAAAAGYQYQEQHPYTHGGVNQNHWNAAAGSYYYSPSANVNLQNQWGGLGYGHHGAPNLLPACGMRPAGQAQFHSQQPGVLPEQTANQQLRGAPEQWPAGSGGDAAQAWTAWTPRKRWRSRSRGARVDM